MWAPGGGALILQSARPVQFAAGAFDDIVCANNPSVSRTADSLSLRLGHGAALICHRHIIHYRAATSLPLTQGRLLDGAVSHSLHWGGFRGTRKAPFPGGKGGLIGWGIIRRLVLPGRSW